MGVAFDLFSVKLLVERVSDGLAQTLVGRGLPAEMQGLVRDVVFTDLVGDHYVKSYPFSSPEDGRVQVDVDVRYEIRNYSEAVRDYAPELTAETFFQLEVRFLLGIRALLPITIGIYSIAAIALWMQHNKAGPPQTVNCRTSQR